jgi:DNA-binding NarL/FixJ family response regulator
MKTAQGVSPSEGGTKRLRDGIQATSLSPREEEILGLVTQGLTNKEIAASLNLAVPTVNQFVNRLFLKTGVHNRTQLAVFALQGYESGKAGVHKK